MNPPISKGATITGMKLNSRQHLMKWGIVFGVTILYLLSVPFLIPIFGSAITALSGFPIVIAGWYFGLTGGIIASIIATTLNIILLSLFGSAPWYVSDHNGFFISTLILITIGFSAGKMKQAYNTRIKAETQLREREQFLSLLNDMTQAIIAAQDFETMMQILVNDLTTLLKADTCYITRWDPVKEQVFPVATNAKAGHPFLTLKYPKEEKNLTSSALEAGHVLVVEDTSNTPHTNPRLVRLFTEKSFISIPLIYGERKLGAAVVRCNEAGQFTPEKIKNAEQAANQIALAVWNMQQDFELKKRLQEVETLERISRALSETEKIGLQTVLQLIVTSAKELIPAAEQAVIHLLDKEKQLLEAQAVSGYEDASINWRLIKIRPNEGVAGLALVNGQTINIADIEKDKRFVTYAETPKYRSLMVAPVQSGEQKLGTLSA